MVTRTRPTQDQANKIGQSVASIDWLSQGETWRMRKRACWGEFERVTVGSWGGNDQNTLHICRKLSKNR